MQLPRREEERAVLPDRAAAGERIGRVHLVELDALERGTRDLVDRRVLRVPLVVGEQVLERALETIRARLGDDVDDRALRAAVFGADRGGQHADFLDGFEVQVRAERARGRVGRVDRVDDEQVVVVSAPALLTLPVPTTPGAVPVRA